MRYHICTTFSISPIEVNNTPFKEVVDMLIDIVREENRMKKQKDGNYVIRKKASDNWF